MKNIGPRSRTSTAILGCLLLATVLVSSGHAEQARDPDDPLLFYAATVNRTPMQSWGPGAGIFLGQGLVITAAHVVGMTFLTRPKVIIGGQEFSTSTIKRGSFEDVDLTLLSFDDSALPLRYRLRRNIICSKDPWPGEEVVTVVPGRVVHSVVISPRLLPPATQKFSTVIKDVAETGNSGSGVFDVQQRCLLGIMSRKISQRIYNKMTMKSEMRDVAKYFVPASVIADFIPAEFKIPRLARSQ